MGECKTKAIHTNLGTFRHNQTYPEIILAYSGIFRTLCCPDIFKTMVCPESWHIPNQKHIQNPSIFTTLVHSEPRYIQSAGIFKIWGIFRTLQYIYDEALIIFTAIIIFTNYNYFRKACVTPCKNYGAWGGRGLWIFDILIDIFK